MVEISNSSVPRSVKRQIFRLIAVLLGLSPLLLIEVGLRLAGVGYLSEADDPHIGFSQIRPLFIRDGDQYSVDPVRHAYFRPESLLVQKPSNEFRVFCLGGSTVQGRPYAIETSFTTWLELKLRAADPGRDWNVVNCGGVSYASYRLVPILKEVLRYEPDLIIVYSGHNEFLEDRTYRDIRNAPRLLMRAHDWFSSFHLYNAGRSAWRWTMRGRQSGPGEILETEVDAMLDYEDGLADYHRDDQWRAGAVEHYEVNMRRIVQLSRQANVQLILANPVSNLSDNSPFKVENDLNLSAQELARFRAIWKELREEKDLSLRVDLLRRAVAIDPRHAGAQYGLGKSLEQLRLWPEAQAAYIRAKDEDICPLRMIEPLHDALQKVATQTSTPLVDVRKLFEEESRGGIPGERWLLDHVHPSINGHQLIAEKLFETMERLGLVQRHPGSGERQEVLFAEHLDSLDPAYFVHGQQRLRGLIFWTKGQSSKKKG